MGYRTGQQRIFDGVQIAQDQFSAAFSLMNMDTWSLIANWTDGTPSPETFDPPDVATESDSIGIAAHAFVDELPVQLTTTGTLPAPLALATTYFIIVVDANFIQLEASVGGGAIDLTDSGTGTHTITPVALAPEILNAGWDDTADEINETAHGFVDEEVVQLTTTGTLPTGFSLATNYFVIFVDVDTFQLEASVGGGAINFTDSGSGDHTVTRFTAADDMEDVAPIAEQINIPAHGFVDELIVQLTTATTLPAGLSLATNYWVIVDDVDTIRLAISLANARTGTAVNITDGGTGTHTATAEAISVTLTVQYANTKVPIESDWVDDSLNIVMNGGPLFGTLEDLNVGYRHLRLRTVVGTGGAGLLTVDINAKGGA